MVASAQPGLLRKGGLALAVVWFGFVSPAFAFEKQSFGRQGVVVCEDPRVAAIGVEVLQAGGNAVDAAVAVGFALAVVFPQAGNLGGGGFLVSYVPGEGAFALDFREIAPAQATPTMYLDERGEVIPRRSLDGYLAAGVPGTPAGLYEAHRRWGRLPWSRLLAPAIRLAEKGFATHTALYLALLRQRDRLLRDPEFARIFFNGGEPKAWITQPELARTLRTIASQGRRGFYEGWVAEAIESAMQANGGLITRRDLAAYEPKWRDPVVFSVGDSTVVTMSLPSSGGWILWFLFSVLEDLRTPAIGWHSALHVNLVVEAEKRAFAERADHMGDPDFHPMPSFLLSPTYFRQMARRLRPFRVTPSDAIAPTREPFTGESKETTHFSIIDRDGMAISVTYTLNGTFGAGVIVPRTGVILNNEMDDFAIKPGYPNLYGLLGGRANAIAPHKRMLSSMTPTIVLRGERVVGVLGSPGGPTIITTVYQVLENVLIFRMAPFPAVMAPRFHHQWKPDEIRHEPTAFTADTERVLRGLGYRLRTVSSLGRVQMIWAWRDGYWGISDPRGPGGTAAIR